MTDFMKLLAANEVIRQLDTNNVPGVGTLSWSRVLQFAKTYKEDVVDFQIEPLPTNFKLSSDQEKAWDKLDRWKDTDEPYFVLRGYAGSGKTFLLQMLTHSGADIIFTAPTNKATKVLHRAVKKKAATTYSALGIRMTQNEDKLELTFSDKPPEIPRKTILVIDECSMVGEQLYNFVDQTQTRTQCKILYVGDPAQLPPVGEARSKSWRATQDKRCRSFLKKIMRYDNELLNLATKIRECIEDQSFNARIRNANDGNEGVFLHRDLMKPVLGFNNPADWQSRKVIAWRNKTVDAYNNSIRENFGFTQPYQVGDILLVADPVEQDGEIIASVDEEFVVTDVKTDTRRVFHHEMPYDIDVWRLDVTGDIDVSLYVAKNQTDVDRILNAKAEIAREAKNAARRAAWRDFWQTKALFHRVRYGYALTAHRAQGSTYAEVYVDQRDILLNQNKREAYRCLYVAATRATTSVHSA